MMAASLSFPSASSEQSKASQSTYETNQDLNNAVDDEFGSFTAAEQLSDPFGDVYGAEAEFGEFVGGFNGHKHEQETSGFSVAMESSLLVSLSPLMTPLTTTAVPTLLPTTCDEIDPFAGITGIHETISGCQEEEEKMTEVTKAIEGDVVDGKVTAASSLKSSATSAILDLVWGKTSPGKDVNSMSTLLMSIESGRSRTASNSSGFALPYSTSTPFATFPSTAIKTSETSTDLLSFSPVQASVPTDPFDEIDCDKNPTSVAAPVYENDELFTMTAMAPLSSASSSAPTSPRKLFVSLHDDVTNPRLVPFAHDSVEIKALPRDPFAKRTTRPFDPLSLSFVGAGGDGKHSWSKWIACVIQHIS
ncbi:unnamed protein product [Peronospora belbahrii]|uniref:Uncharacterized protein n=1 Tax=Peronospora belbahrii TaxID=622444 RepID=A0AAU9L415_9STRA|nr:unnamed protein product [Peronospora belbahrii]